MKTKYLLELFFTGYYQEIELEEGKETEIIIGTTKDCNLRFPTDRFFCDFEIKVISDGKTARLLCGDSIYFNNNSTMKLYSVELTHGLRMSIHYQDAGAAFCEVEYMRNFERETYDYSRSINIQNMDHLTIGSGNDCQIKIHDEAIENDRISLHRRNGSWEITELKTYYGVYLNGNRINHPVKLVDYDFISITGHRFFLCGDRFYICNDEDMEICGVQLLEHKDSRTAMVYPHFNRSTRVYYQLPDEKIEILPPKVQQKETNQNIFTIILPMIAMLAVTIVVRGQMGSGGTFVIFSACTMSIGIITSTINYFRQRKAAKKAEINRVEKYEEYIQQKEQEIRALREKEVKILEENTPEIEASLQEVWAFGDRLYERMPEDPDFVSVRLGTGAMESKCPVSFNKQEYHDSEDDLLDWPERLEKKYHMQPSVPVLIDLKDTGTVGIIGDSDRIYETVKEMIMDLAAHHSFQELRIGLMCSPEDAVRWSWLRWMRHIQNEELGTRFFAYDEDSYVYFAEYIYKEVMEREGADGETGRQKKQQLPHYVIFITESYDLMKHPVSRFFNMEDNYGVTFVFCGKNKELLPQCKKLIRLNEDTGYEMITSNDGGRIQNYLPFFVSDENAKRVAEKLACVIIDEVSLAGQLTKNITLYRLLGIYSAGDLNLEKRWSESRVENSLAAPLGIDTKGDVISLDLHEKAHGPHGLVAGTTGSGKSETMQSYILSMAVTFHPYEVGFVIIDFKGGGMVNQFKDLPHLIGSITDIDGHEINRSLMSIRAELNRRKELFASAGVNRIDDYILKYRNHEVQIPLPHLILIVDEFAELKAEQPDFMKELISAARIGRSLGVHLILATQKPSGVVDAQIWSNSRFRLCLKVATSEDSREMLKTPLAAEIREPGRAYLQVGNNEIFELFQSAYSGGAADSEIYMGQKAYSINEVALDGQKKELFSLKPEKRTDSENETTQLEELVTAVNRYCMENDIKHLPEICLPPLASKISTEDLDYGQKQDELISIPIGIFDDPELQYQGELSLDLAKENVYIVGSSQMGKTVILQSIAYGLIRKYPVSKVNLYFVDCGSMVLKNFESSNHVGGVVVASEEEKCKNLFKLLNSFVTERKKKLSEKGVGNFAAYLEGGFDDMPLVVVMIDNMAGFKEYYPDQADMITSLTREAQGVGISFVITAAASNALNYRAQANFGEKLVLNCNDSSEYNNVFGHCKMSPREIPGRGLFLQEKRILEWQAAIYGSSEREAERSQELRQYLDSRNAMSQFKAVKIPVVPERLVLTEAMRDDPQKFREAGMIPVGMDFSNVEYSCININQLGVLALIGENDPRIAFAKNLLLLLSKTVVFHNVEAFIIDNKQKSLESVEDFGFVRGYTTDLAEGSAILADFYQEVQIRADNPGNEDATTVLLVMNSPDLYRQICADKATAAELSDVMKKAENNKAFILLTQVENQAAGFNASDVQKTIKEMRKGIMFGQISDNKLFELNGRARPDPLFEDTQAFRIDNGNFSKIKLFE